MCQVVVRNVDGGGEGRRGRTYGAGLTRHLQACGEKVFELDRPKRPARRNGAKTDALDAVRTPAMRWR